MATSHEVAGPVQWHVGVGAAGALSFLGWAEGDTRISLAAAEDEIRTDLGGPAIPSDVQFMGEQAFISCDLSRWDKAVLKKLKSRLPSANNSNVSGGTYSVGQMGALMIAEGYAVRLLLKGGYSAKNLNSGDLPIWNFLAAWPTSNLDVGISTRASRFRLTMRAIPVIDWGTGSSTLYNQDVTGIPSIS